MIEISKYPNSDLVFSGDDPYFLVKATGVYEAPTDGVCTFALRVVTWGVRSQIHLKTQEFSLSVPFANTGATTYEARLYTADLINNAISEVMLTAGQFTTGVESASNYETTGCFIQVYSAAGETFTVGEPERITTSSETVIKYPDALMFHPFCMCAFSGKPLWYGTGKFYSDYSVFPAGMLTGRPLMTNTLSDGTTIPILTFYADEMFAPIRFYYKWKLPRASMALNIGRYEGANYYPATSFSVKPFDDDFCMHHGGEGFSREETDEENPQAWVDVAQKPITTPAVYIAYSIRLCIVENPPLPFIRFKYLSNLGTVDVLTLHGHITEAFAVEQGAEYTATHDIPSLSDYRPLTLQEAGTLKRIYNLQVEQMPAWQRASVIDMLRSGFVWAEITPEEGNCLQQWNTAIQKPHMVYCKVEGAPIFPHRQNQPTENFNLTITLFDN